MIALLKTMVSSLIVCAVALAIAAVIVSATGWFALERFGALTMVVMAILGCFLFLVVFAGVAIGTIAVAYAPNHPVITATIAATSLCACALILAAPLDLDIDVVAGFAPVVIGIAPWRAWSMTRSERAEP